MSDIKLVGRLGRDVVSFNNDNGSQTHILNIARPRNYANAQGEYVSDFVEFKAFTTTDKAHNFYKKHMKKGRLVEVTADFSSNTYMKDGQKVYSTDCIIDDINPFLERISTQNERENQVQQPVQNSQYQSQQVPVQNQQHQQQQAPAQNQQYQQAPPAQQTAAQNPAADLTPYDFLGL